VRARTFALGHVDVVDFVVREATSRLP